MVLTWILAILPGLILWSFLEKKLLRVTEYSIPAGHHESAPEDFKLVLLADLHNNTFGRRNAGLIKKIRELKPDAVVVAGDLITKQQLCIPGNAYALLDELAKDYPVYYGYGNHELHLSELPEEQGEQGKSDHGRKAKYESWLKFVQVLKSKGVHFLPDQSAGLKHGKASIRFVGLNVGREAYSGKELFPMDNNYLKKHIGQGHPEEYQILIAHNPLYFQNYIKWGADLILAGHLHGGLVRLPHFGGIISPQYKLFPKYDSGVFTENNRHMVVSRGLGSHSVMLRLFNRPELVFIRIKGQV